MKYIIDVPNNGYVSEEDGCLYIPLRSDGCDPLMVNPTWLLTGYHAEPYIEPDRKAIENETWDLVNRIADMSYEDFISCFEGETEEYVYGLPYHEVKAKYEEWKKQKEDEATMKEVTALAEKIGIHKLYSMVKEIRGE